MCRANGTYCQFHNEVHTVALHEVIDPSGLIFFLFQVTGQLGRLSQLAPRQSTRNENVNISPDNGKYTENGTTTTTVIKIYTMIPW